MFCDTSLLGESLGLLLESCSGVLVWVGFVAGLQAIHRSFGLFGIQIMAVSLWITLLVHWAVIFLAYMSLIGLWEVAFVSKCYWLINLAIGEFLVTVELWCSLSKRRNAQDLIMIF